MNRIRTMFVLLATALVAGCGSDDARLTVLLKDAGSPEIKQAWVRVSEINLVGSGGVMKLGPGQETTVKLTDLVDRTATLVQDAVVPPGKYTELRFVLTGGCIQVGDSSFYAASPDEHMDAGCMSAAGALKMPSMGQSGLKVTMSGNALDVAAGSKVLFVDFQVAQSFGLEAGGSGSWVMHPVITGGDIGLSGNVQVTVVLPSAVNVPSTVTSLGSCIVTLTSADSTAAPIPTGSMTVTSSTAGTALLYPPPGSYNAALACTGANVSASQSPANPVQVSAGQASPITFTVVTVSSLP